MVSASPLLDDIFDTAVANFAASLTEKQRRNFHSCSRKDVERTILGIDSRLASERKQQNMRRMAKFIEGMTQLGKVIEVFVNCDATVAFIWGPIKFVLLAAGTWVETLDCLLDTYSEIGEYLPGLSHYEALLGKYPQIGIHLQRYYGDVLEFHKEALSVFSRPRWKAAFHSSWKTFRTTFQPVLDRLKRHRDLLSDEKLSVAVAEIRDSREALEDKLDELARRVQQLHFDNEEEKSLHLREALNKKRDFVQAKLDPPDQLFDLEKASEERKNPASGDWLLAEEGFVQWSNLGTMEHRELYLHGIPGTGKTILASKAIKHLQSMRATAGQGGTALPHGFSVIYFFFKHQQPDKRTFTALLLSILWQTVLLDEVVLDLIYKRLASEGPQKIRSVSLLRELAELALGIQRRCFIVVDGLDECGGPNGHNSEDAQRQVIKWLEGLKGGDGEGEERCVRLFISGQQNGCLEERLGHWPAVRVDSCLAHMGDIRTYSEAKMSDISQRFRLDENTGTGILEKINARAAGMFLYAKVVLDNLLSQPTVRRFKRELKDENFPKRMDQAYERVAVRILEEREKSQCELARQILELVICAERPLLWKEIRSRFCIDVQSATADPDERPLDPCKKYCGSLVEVGRHGKLGSVPDESVELVHETARTYLLQTTRWKFCLANLHAEMALFCTQYLTSSPFGLTAAKADVETHCRTGYYGFLDYAAANWWKHVKQLERGLDQTTIETITMLSTKKDARAEIPSAIQQLQDDGREWEKLFPLEDRINLARDCIEAIVNNPTDENPTELNTVREFYGCPGCKCRKPWCHFFLAGFDTKDARDDHLRQHDRPFRCNTNGCFGYQVGFATQSDLVAHNHRLHPQDLTDTAEFPSTAEMDIFTAASEGNLGVVQDLVERGTNVNEKNKDQATPLFVAATAGRYDVCQWLLEHGARVNSLSTKRRATALHAAVSNGDAELARLLIVDHGADVYARDTSGKSVVQLMRSKGNEAVCMVAPPGSLDHDACTKDGCKRANVWRRMLEEKIFSGDTIALHDLLKRSCLDLNQCWKRGYGPHGVLLRLGNNSINVDNLFPGTGRVDCDVADRQGRLPLHSACRQALVGIVPQLLVMTASPNKRDNFGNTPLDLLLDCNADLNDDSSARRAALTTGMLKSGLVDVTQSRSQSALRQACRVSTRGVLAALLPFTRHLDPWSNTDQDDSTNSPFHIAVARGDLSVLAALLEYQREHWPDTDGNPWTAQERDYLCLTELIEKRDSSLLSTPSSGDRPLSLLHFGAYHLDQALIQQVIHMESGTDGNPALFNWRPPTLGPDFVSNGQTRQPVFIAMSVYRRARESVSGIELEGRRANFLAAFDTLVAYMGLDPFPFADLELNSMAWFDEMLLINQCCDLEMVTRMAQAGFTLPWKLLRWGSDGKIRITPDSLMSQGLVLEPDIVLGVVCSGGCQFVRILKANLSFAQDLLNSGRISPASLVLDGDELEILYILAKFLPGESVDLLRELIRLGFNAGSALLQATEAGWETEARLLLDTSDEMVLANAETAQSLAHSKGFGRIAEMLASNTVERAEILGGYTIQWDDNW